MEHTLKISLTDQQEALAAIALRVGTGKATTADELLAAFAIEKLEEQPLRFQALVQAQVAKLANMPSIGHAVALGSVIAQFTELTPESQASLQSTVLPALAAAVQKAYDAQGAD